ncbi:MAG TPA: hypothetical protein VFW63_03905 [Acidimicrobiales bacterium]|nr:hypothetical protein [Acidimicrobiales bacterium]
MDQLLDVAVPAGAVGVAAAAALAATAVALRARWRPLPGAGLAMAAAGLVATAVAHGGPPPRPGQVAGVGLAALGGWSARRARLRWPADAVLVLPGAAVATVALHVGAALGVAWSTVAAAALLGPVVGRADHSLAASAAGPPLMAASVAGLYAAVPDTDRILPVLVAVVPVALVGAPLGLSRLGTAGSAAMVALLGGVAAEGGQARAASIVGGLAGLGVLILEPVARAVAPRARRPWPTRWWHPRVLLLAAVHAALVATTSRVAGTGEGVARSAGIVAASGATALIALIVLVTDVERAERDR